MGNGGAWNEGADQRLLLARVASLHLFSEILEASKGQNVFAARSEYAQSALEQPCQF